MTEIWHALIIDRDRNEKLRQQKYLQHPFDIIEELWILRIMFNYLRSRAILLSMVRSRTDLSRPLSWSESNRTTQLFLGFSDKPSADRIRRSRFP